MQLTAVKLAYFVLLGAYSGLFPYLPVFMGVLGLSPIQMSIILGVATFSSGPTRLIIGYVADRFQKRPQVFAVSALLGSVFYTSLYFTPTIDEYSVRFGNLTCFYANYSVRINITTNPSMLPNLTHNDFEQECCCCQLESCTENYFHNSTDLRNFYVEIYNTSILCSDQCQRSRRSNNKTFVFFFIIFYLANSSFSPLQSILDSLIQAFLAKTKYSSEFGKCRVWGSVGYGCCAFFSAFVIEVLVKFGWKGRCVFAFNFAFLGFGLVASSLIASFIAHKRKPLKSECLQTAATTILSAEQIDDCSLAVLSDKLQSKSSFKGKKVLSRMFYSFYLTTLMATAFVSGSMAGCFGGFFYYFLASIDPNNKLVLGVSLGVACLAEVTVLCVSGKIIERLGYHKCLYLVFLAFSLRSLAASFLTNPWFGPLIDATQGICFGLLYPVMSTWASSLVSPELYSTVQCYLGAAYYDLGMAIGMAFGGVVYEIIGPRIMFRILTFVAATYVILLFLIFELSDKIRLKRHTSTKLSMMGPVLEKQ